MSSTRLDTERLVLRRFGEADFEPLLAWRSDPEVARYQVWGPQGPDAVRDWLGQVMAGEPAVPGTWFQFAIEVRETGRMVGDIGLRTDVDPRLAEVGFTLSRDGQGRGYATEALRAVLGCAFLQGVHRVTGNCDARNSASARLMERVGMRREAHHVEDWWVRDTWTSSFVYAMLAREFSGNGM